MNCPYCNSDEESHAVRLSVRRPFDDTQCECRECGCEFDTTKPGEIQGFAYDDPREPSDPINHALRSEDFPEEDLHPSRAPR
jgi:hypothetical protein